MANLPLDIPSGPYNKPVKWNNSNQGNGGHSEWGCANDNQGGTRSIVREGSRIGAPRGPWEANS
jgi:hypothetical protein